MTINAITQADFDEWSGLWRGYLTFYGTQLSDEITADTFRRLVEDGEQRCWPHHRPTEGELLPLAERDLDAGVEVAAELGRQPFRQLADDLGCGRPLEGAPVVWRPGADRPLVW